MHVQHSQHFDKPAIPCLAAIIHRTRKNRVTRLELMQDGDSKIFAMRAWIILLYCMCVCGRRKFCMRKRKRRRTGDTPFINKNRYLSCPRLPQGVPSNCPPSRERLCNAATECQTRKMKPLTPSHALDLFLAPDDKREKSRTPYCVYLNLKKSIRC